MKKLWKSRFREVLVVVGSVICISLPYVLLGLVPLDVSVVLLVATTAILVGFVVSTRHRVKWGTEFVLALAATCLTVSAVDLVLRPFAVHLFAFRIHESLFYMTSHKPPLYRYRPNVRCEMTEFGDLAAMTRDPHHRVPRHVVFSTDSYGFRNTRDACASPSELVILGDSTGVGSGTTQSRTWAELLHSRFNHQVYNLCMPGSPWHELLNLKAEWPRLTPGPKVTLVWEIFVGNDLDEYYGESLEVTPGSFVDNLVGDLSEFRRRSPLTRCIEAFTGHRLLKRTMSVPKRRFPDGREMLFHPDYAAACQRSLPQVMAHGNFPKLQDVFRDMAVFSKNKDFRVVVVLFPCKEEVYSWVLNGAPPWTSDPRPSGFSEALQKLSEEHGFTFLDLKPHLADAALEVFQARKACLWWHDDTHLGESGHEVVAATLEREVLVQRNDVSRGVDKPARR